VKALKQPALHRTGISLMAQSGWPIRTTLTWFALLHVDVPTQAKQIEDAVEARLLPQRPEFTPRAVDRASALI
jgi:hypothetical protein